MNKKVDPSVWGKNGSGTTFAAVSRFDWREDLRGALVLDLPFIFEGWAREGEEGFLERIKMRCLTREVIDD